MIDWINKTFGISSEVSVPTVISIIVFILGGTINFLFVQFKAFYDRKNRRITFLLLLSYVIKDLKVKIHNVERLKNQMSVNYEDGFSYSQKSISYLEVIFEYGFKEIFFSFRKRFFWNICSRRIKYKAFNKVRDSLIELKFFETKIYEHLEEFDKNFDERLKNYNSSLKEFTNFMATHSETNNELLESERKVLISWNYFKGEKSHYHHTYILLISPLIELNFNWQKSKVDNRKLQLLIDCKNDYKEIENVIETGEKIFSTYFQFYRNKNRLLRKCLDVIGK